MKDTIERTPFTLALVQMLVEGGEKHSNLRRAETLIHAAASAGAKVVVLPECMDLGWTHPSALTLAEPVHEGKAASLLCKLAKKHGIYICDLKLKCKGNSFFRLCIVSLASCRLFS